MDTVHDLPARQDDTGRLAQLAQTVAMLAEALNRQRRAHERREPLPRYAERPALPLASLVAEAMARQGSPGAGDALSRAGAARAAGQAEPDGAVHAAAVYEDAATPTVDEHAVAAGEQHTHQAAAVADQATADRALAEARVAVAGVRQAAAQRVIAGNGNARPFAGSTSGARAAQTPRRTR